MHLVESRIRTLVVDDSPIAVRTVCSVLQKQEGYEVIATAHDGQEALALLPRLRPALVLLDLEMPGMNGLETATQMERDFPETKVIMVTVHDTPETRRRCLQGGAHGFVSKDHLSQELPIVLHQVLEPLAN